MKTKKDEQTIQWIQNNTIPSSLISYSDRSIQIKFSKVIEKYRLGMGQFSILMNIHDEEGCTQDELAAMRGFNKSMVAKSVAKLEEEGYIYRVIDPDDNRIRRLYLTDHGRTIYPELFQIGLNFDHKIYKDFSNEERDALIGYL